MLLSWISAEILSQRTRSSSYRRSVNVQLSVPSAQVCVAVLKPGVLSSLVPVGLRHWKLHFDPGGVDCRVRVYGFW